jgi:6-phosphogluconolactonase (cycloisomerase 2 family)
MRAFTCAFLALILALTLACGSSSKTFPQVSFVYVSGQSANAVQALSLRQNGQLQALSVSTFPTNPRPSSMALTPAKNFLYVANDTANTVSGFSLDHTTGVLNPVGTAVTPSPVGTTPISVGVSSNGQFLFVLNQGSSNISVFSIDTRGLLTPVAGSPFPAPANPQFMLVSPSASFVYISAGNTIATLPFSATGAIGAAVSTFTSPSAGATIQGTAIDSKGQFLYATDSTNNQLLVLSPQPSGALTQVGSPAPTGTKPVNVAVNSSGNLVYVSNQGSNDVTGYQVNAGALTLVTGSPFATGGSGASGNALLTAPGYLIFDASNTFLLVCNTNTRSIAVFLIDTTTGAALPVTDSPFGQGTAPTWLVSTI